jgi:phosphoglycolate phosphatase
VIQLVIFDLDGTLVDSLQDITNAVNYSIQGLGLPEFSVSQIIELIGEGISSLIGKILPDHLSEMKDQVLDRFLEYYSEHLLDNTRPYPGVKETLQALTAYKKAVVSNKREILSRKILKNLDLLSHFDILIGSETVKEKKPSPMPIIFALEKFSLSPRNAVIVGDSDVDIKAGKAAGTFTIAVTYGYRHRSSLSTADYIIDSFSDLRHILRELL